MVRMPIIIAPCIFFIERIAIKIKVLSEFFSGAELEDNILRFDSH